MDELRTAVVGLRFGRTWANGFKHHPRCRLACLCDLEAAKLCHVAAETEPDRTTTCFEDVVTDESIDAVGLFTPAPLHAEQAASLLRAGKHVLCAVPAAVTVEQCREVVAAACGARGVYMMAENWPYEPSVLKAFELYRAGALGDIFYGEAEYLHHLESLWFTSEGQPTWRLTLQPLLYPTHGLGPYLSMTQDRFVEVTAHSVSGVRPPGAEPKKDWLQLAVLRSAKGCLFKLMNSFCNVHPGGHYLSFYGDRGSFETARGHEGRTVATYWLHGSEERVMTREKCAYPPLPEYVGGMGGHSGPAVAIIEDFVRAALDGEPNPIDVCAAADMTLPGIVGLDSVRQGRTMPIPDPRDWLA